MDDVAYMKSFKGTTQESYNFLADSRRRDLSVHQQPSEYTIEFASPFRNVCSFSLLDATIPRTHYSIDEGYNTLVYSVTYDNGGTFETATATIDVGDYTLPQLCDALNDVLIGGLRVDPLTLPFDRSNKARFTRMDGAFALAMKTSGLSQALGYLPLSAPYQSTVSSDVTTTHGGPGKDGGTRISLTSAGTTTIRQKCIATASGTLHAIDLVNDTASASTVRIDVSLRAADGTTVLASGTVIPSASSGVVLLDANPAIVEGTAYYLLASLSQGAETGVYAAPGDGEGPVERLVNGIWTADPDDLQLACSITVSTQVYESVSPGLVDITGEKLVLIRCPEIEQVLFRDRYNEQMHAGLGYVKLAGLGFREGRGDYFVPFPPRTFHPIAKLSKLTIRLETPDGRVYPTRGVDHTILLNIVYYRVVAEPKSPTMINPQYSGRIHEVRQPLGRRGMSGSLT